MTGYIQRSLEPILKKVIKQFPAVVLTGPRQAGKTTLLKKLFGAKYQYVSLEPPDIRAAAESDPRGFIELHSAPIIFDEIQYAPNLLFYIKEKIDEERGEYGQFILTGSQNILLSQHVAETLAGRAAILKLLPLSYIEIIKRPFDLFAWEDEKTAFKRKKLPIKNFWELILKGGFPELIEHSEKDFLQWHGSYIQTYLERDVRSLRQIGDLTQFQLFLRAVAARSGQLFQMSDVANDIGLSVNTVKSWLGILEATYQIIVLRPYFLNTSKRLVKTPKIYFTDVGTLCYLMGLKDIEHLLSGPMAGPIVETYVVVEIYKRFIHRGFMPQMYFWRTSSGIEVDILIEDQGSLIPIEVKATSTPNAKMANGILSFKKDMKKSVKKGYVIHLGEMPLPLAKEVKALPFAQL